MTDSEMLALIQAELPDSYTESKDWRYGDALERIIWLKLMLESKTREIEGLLDMNEKHTDRLSAEIERLRGDLKKAVELALEECPFREGTGSYNDWWHHRRTTLAKLTGDKT